MTNQESTSKAPKILVTGAGGPAGYSVIQRLLDTHPTYEIHAADASPLASGLFLVPLHCRHIVPLGKSPRFLTTVREICRSAAVDLVIPTVDTELLPMAASTERFASHNTRVAVSPVSGLRACEDKVRLTRVLQGLMPTAPTEVWTGQDLPADWCHSLVAKPRQGSGGRGVSIIREPAQLRAVPTDGSYLIMEYLPGPEYSVDVFRTRAGNVIAAVPRERLLVDSGVAIAARTLHDPELERYAARAVDALELEGVANVQFRRDHSGRPTLLEINPRFPGTMPLTIGAGIDMPNLAVADALGYGVPQEQLGFKEVALVRRWADQFVDPQALVGRTPDLCAAG
ncbi:MAG: ATP-grasp domain-containing protein [Nannocystaceae bacterium]|nr:ATP-grasp domain-containing protein [Nannocystaceae bacterium]